MARYIPSREDAYDLLQKHVKDESLINHSLMVEAVMAHFAQKFDEDVEKWRTIGLIHDLDFEEYPEEHCKMTKEILEKENWPEDYIRGVLSHGWQICTDVEPVHIMEKIIYTIDELTGLIYATAIMRPSKSLDDLKVKSVKKKWKQKSFAQKIDRDMIKNGVEMLPLELNEMIEETIEGMKSVAKDIGLKTIED
ncbi:MAG: HDIG domain-containing metalloprotein [Tissierella sp.]|uniref:HDIG domain-containing metalloprotein n=1 Tax=Tissierella sp. TaxID=41274 RepID=UPI003F948F1A